jgi:para-aminobenzoate synthetase/4-amino-4-deoxychorismate lyase
MLMRAPPDFRLVESMLWTPERGAAWLRDHLERMEGSALYFGFAIDRAGVAARVEEAASRLPPAPHKLRVELDRDGTARVCASEVPRTPPSYTVCLAARPVRSEDPFLYHKTTHREVYERALAERPAGCDDVLLWNERGELTESCIANLVVELDGAWITPPVSSGLLGGIGRRRLLREGRAVERPVDRDVLRRCSAIHLVNAVRGTWRVRLGG